MMNVKEIGQKVHCFLCSSIFYNLEWPFFGTYIFVTGPMSLLLFFIHVLVVVDKHNRVMINSMLA
jgi:hypothetical protein